MWCPPSRCGSDARLSSAKEFSCSAEASVPYFIPALTVTVAPSTITSSGSPLMSTRSPGVSAMSLKQCLLPRALTRSAPATISWSCSTESGRCSRGAR